METMSKKRSHVIWFILCQFFYAYQFYLRTSGRLAKSLFGIRARNARCMLNVRIRRSLCLVCTSNSCSFGPSECALLRHEPFLSIDKEIIKG